MPVVKRYTFFARTKMKSNEVNQNFDDIVAAFNTHTHTNTGTDAPLVTVSGLAPGVPVQVVSTNYSAVATGTGIIPFDDTIPQITEGTEFMTQTITPKASTNILIIELVFFGANSVGDDVVVALFQDSAANALAANSVYNATATARLILPLSHSMPAGTTSATTFRARAGSIRAATTTFNGQSATRAFGAATKSFIKVTEVKA